MTATTRWLIRGGMVIAALLFASPSAGAECATQLDPSGGFWRDLKVASVTCVRGGEIARPWIRRYGRPFLKTGKRPRNPQRILEWTCRLEVLRDTENPYGRITCRRGVGRIIFYGA